MIDFSNFQNGVNHPCTQLVSILKANLSKTIMKCKIFMLFSFQAFLSKSIFLRLQNFISPGAFLIKPFFQGYFVSIILGIAPHGGKELENMNFRKMKENSFFKKPNAWKTFYC